jgi:hypothetical protein
MYICICICTGHMSSFVFFITVVQQVIMKCEEFV